MANDLKTTIEVGLWGWQVTSDTSRTARKIVSILDRAGWTCVPPGPPHDQHYVTFGENDWWTEHSIQCRMAGEIPTCQFHEAAKGLADKMQGQGRYRIIMHEDGYTLEHDDG